MAGIAALGPQSGKEYGVNLGPSLLAPTRGRGPSYTCVRYDFKPASLQASGTGSWSHEVDTNRVVLTIPSARQGQENHFSGQLEQNRDDLDCVAIFDGSSFTLELVSSQVKARLQRGGTAGPVSAGMATGGAPGTSQATHSGSAGNNSSGIDGLFQSDEEGEEGHGPDTAIDCDAAAAGVKPRSPSSTPPQITQKLTQQLAQGSKAPSPPARVGYTSAAAAGNGNKSNKAPSSPQTAAAPPSRSAAPAPTRAVVPSSAITEPPPHPRLAPVQPAPAAVPALKNQRGSELHARSAGPASTQHQPAARQPPQQSAQPAVAPRQAAPTAVAPRPAPARPVAPPISTEVKKAADEWGFHGMDEDDEDEDEEEDAEPPVPAAPSGRGTTATSAGAQWAAGDDAMDDDHEDDDDDDDDAHMMCSDDEVSDGVGPEYRLS